MKTSRILLPFGVVIMAVAAAFATHQKPSQTEALAAFWEKQSVSNCVQIDCSTTNTGSNCQLTYPIHSNASCNQTADVTGLKRP